MPHGRKTGGRTAGTPNRTTASVRAAILAAFDQAGGAAYLTKVARDDPPTFLRLLGRMLPTQVTGEDGGLVQLGLADALSMARRRSMRSA